VATVYRASRVFDGKSERVIEYSMVVIEQDLIASVGPAVETPPGTKIMDLGDATLLPGLNDTHVHLVWSASAEPHNWSRALTVLHCTHSVIQITPDRRLP
jgi:imidazolonepropionase-like amidohydrolase